MTDRPLADRRADHALAQIMLDELKAQSISIDQVGDDGDLASVLVEGFVDLARLAGVIRAALSDVDAAAIPASTSALGGGGADYPGCGHVAAGRAEVELVVPRWLLERDRRDGPPDMAGGGLPAGFDRFGGPTLADFGPPPGVRVVPIGGAVDAGTPVVLRDGVAYPAAHFFAVGGRSRLNAGVPSTCQNCGIGRRFSAVFGMVRRFRPWLFVREFRRYSRELGRLARGGKI